MPSQEYKGLGLGDKPGGNETAVHEKSDPEMTTAVAAELNRKLDRLQDNTISLAIRSKEAREFLDWHTNHVKESWLAWMEYSSKVMEEIRLARVAIGSESRTLLTECGEIRKFFLSDDHQKEIAKLREFVEVCERLRSLKNDGTLDKIADTILKLA